MATFASRNDVGEPRFFVTPKSAERKRWVAVIIEKLKTLFGLSASSTWITRGFQLENATALPFEMAFKVK